MSAVARAGVFRCVASLGRSRGGRFTSTSTGFPAPLEGDFAAAVAPIRCAMLAACHSGRSVDVANGAKVGRTACAESLPTKAKQVYESDYKKLLRSLGADEAKKVTPAAAPGTTSPALPTVGDWSEVRNQAETVTTWPSHPLQPSEKLALASAFAARVASLPEHPETEADCGGRICTLYEQLCQSGPPIGPRSDDVVYSGVVAISSEHVLGAASSEIVSLLLHGHAVALAAPRGQALETARKVVAGFPPALLQAVEAGPMTTLPQTVRTFRGIGFKACELWADKVPPADFGGFDPKSRSGSVSHGMAATAFPFTLARTDLPMLASSPKPRFEITKEVDELARLLPKSASSPSATSAYGRGIGEVQTLLDLLWTFRDPVTIPGVSNPVVSLAPAHKHFILTSSTEVHEDIVKAAIVAALSPLEEKVTLHVVGLGALDLLRDPLRSFCRLVQSGRGGLKWRVKEHKDWSSLFSWLDGVAPEEPEPPQLFSTQRQLEIEIRRRCAEIGGVAWTRLFMPEPFEQLRRWTSVCEESEGLRPLH